MYVPLPDLDDRRWTDLVDEGRALIQVYAPVWTDYNFSDPGITLLDLIAWAVEADIYQLDRITEAERRAMLALIGIQLRGPMPSRAAVRFRLLTGTDAISLPAGTELAALPAGAPATLFRTLDDVVVPTAQLGAVLVTNGAALRDATADWANGKPLALFGDPPPDNAAAYFGFTALDSAHPLSIAFVFTNPHAGPGERRRLLDWRKEQAQACSSPFTQPCGGSATVQPATPVTPPHHSAVTVWEALTAQGVWTAIDADDDTRSMTLDGRLRLRFAADVPPLKLGRISKPYQWIRCRLSAGKWDAPPVASLVAPNACFCEQATPLVDRWPLADGVAPKGAPGAGAIASIAVLFNDAGEVSSLDFTDGAEGAARFRFLGLDEHSVTLEALRIGMGDGAPNQWFQLRESGLADCGLRVFTHEDGSFREWRRRGGFTASGPADLDYTFDASAVTLRFGDGQNGRVPPPGAVVVIAASGTFGSGGNVAARAIDTLDAGAYNRAVLADFDSIAARLSIENARAATGGVAAETTKHAEGRAVEARETVTRAVTLNDCEALALTTPGTEIARAAARANHHPAFECYQAPGVITLVVVPNMPGPRPTPSDGLLAAVRTWVGSRRVIGTRIEVTGPEYLEVAVNAAVSAARGENRAALTARIVVALNAFFDPLHGGPDGTGWPLGRNVYISEVLQKIDETPGVDHVDSLSLEVPGCGAQCGDVCLRASALVAAGAHRIEVK
jgi:predicted phage baseplate assembly protein